jgi:hypothetical protein
MLGYTQFYFRIAARAGENFRGPDIIPPGDRFQAAVTVPMNEEYSGRRPVTIRVGHGGTDTFAAIQTATLMPNETVRRVKAAFPGRVITTLKFDEQKKEWAGYNI